MAMTWKTVKTWPGKQWGKWFYGNSWVTRWGDGSITYGIDGRNCGNFEGTANEAKAFIERVSEEKEAEAGIR